jgi:hypothetical protein
MRLSWFVAAICFVLPVGTSAPSGDSPQLVYGTYLGGRHKECATAIAVDGSGNAYVVGRTPSPDFPITPGAFRTATGVNNDGWTGFISKISERGEHLLYSSFLGGNFYSSANAVTVDLAGRAFVVGSTCSSQFPTTSSAVLPRAPGSDKRDVCDGFVAWLNASGSQLDYGSYLGGSRSDAATAISLGPDGNVVFVGGYTSSPDFPVAGAAAQPKLNGSTNGFLSAIDVRSGKLLYSTYLGGTGEDRVTAVAVDTGGKVYVAGSTDSKNWPNMELARYGNVGATDGFIVRLDPAGKLPPLGIRIGGSEEESLASINLDPDGNIYAAGTTNSSDFPVKGANLAKVGSGFVVKISGKRFADKRGSVVWSRRIGGHGDDALLSVSAGLPGSIFVSGRSGSTDFPTTERAIYRHLQAQNDSTLAELRAYDGRIQFATFVGGTRHQNASWYNDEATGVFANAKGDVYVTGCTLDDRLPVTPSALQTRPAGNADVFVLRMKFVSSQQPLQSDNHKNSKP